MFNQKGQINLMGMITIGVAITVATIGGWITQNNITDGKIENLRIEQQTKTDSLVTDVSKININIALICQALKIKCRE